MDEKTIARFWKKVERGEGCWLWTAGCNSLGYGVFWLHGRRFYAHRFAWTLVHGPIPHKLQCLHRCDVPRCVRADGHLFLGTQADNMRDMASKNRGRGKVLLGESNAQAKLTEAHVREILDMGGRFTLSVIAERFGVRKQTVWKILHHQAWCHVR